jgi:hypothetical protein
MFHVSASSSGSVLPLEAAATKFLWNPTDKHFLSFHIPGFEAENFHHKLLQIPKQFF